MWYGSSSFQWGARLAGQTGVMSDLPGGAEYMGTPAMPVKAYFRQIAVLKRLAAMGVRVFAGFGGTEHNNTAQNEPPTASDDETGRN